MANLVSILLKTKMSRRKGEEAATRLTKSTHKSKDKHPKTLFLEKIKLVTIHRVAFFN